ncbi:MAG TPA: cobalamin-binding protein [Cytophagales bacterium]|nr:cobalamin-binding protein [Cytophagales bacterium]HCR53214.1 cobalamin-binding protein [Cytophagales bacterium]
MGREVKLHYPPQRIISLVPSQTELLYDLGLNEEVVGITKFCEHPENWYNSKPKVGGTKNIDFSRIESLLPDLIIGNKEENDKSAIEILQQKYPVWMSDVVTLDDALWMIKAVGEIVGRNERSVAIANQISANFRSVKNQNARVLYLIWKNPWMGAGSNTFIDTMLKTMGLTNVLDGVQRYPELTLEQIQHLNPDQLFFSSEPFPFQEKHMDELRALLPNAKFTLVDGQYFSWYGSRLLSSPAYFNALSLKGRD